MSIFQKIFNFIGKFSLDLKEQNWWNDESSEKKAKKVEVNVEDVTVVTPQFFHPKPDSRITSPFGNRTLTINGQPITRFHSGIDLSGYGLCVAVEDVIIQKVLKPDTKYPCRFKFDPKRGWVDANVPKGRAWTPYVIAIGKTTKTLYKYMHIDSYATPGQHVEAGDRIGVASNLGYSMGSHLHFEAWLIGKNGEHNTPDDPVKVLNKFGVI